MRIQLNMRTIVLGLVVIMVVSFVAAGSIFASQIAWFEKYSAGVEYNIDEEQLFQLGEIADINIETASQRIRIIPIEEDEVRLHLHGRINSSSEGYLPELVAIKDNEKLDIKVKRASTATFFGFVNSNVILDVYLPVNYFGNISIKTSSGRLEIDSLSVSKFEFRSTSGNLEANSISSNRGSIVTTSGRVTVGELQVGKLEQQSTSGNFSVKNLISEEVSFAASSARINIGKLEAGSVKHSTTSGNLDIGKTKIGKGEFSSYSGRITLNNLSGDIDLTSTSGNVTVKYEENFSYDIKIKSSSGRVDLTLPESAEFALDARTSSGRISIEHEVTVSGGVKENHIAGVVRSDSNKVEISTTSGNITLVK